MYNKNPDSGSLKNEEILLNRKNDASLYTPRVLRVPNKKYFSYLSTNTYDVGAQKNRLNEMVLLSTQNIF